MRRKRNPAYKDRHALRRALRQAAKLSRAAEVRQRAKRQRRELDFPEYIDLGGEG